jgi:hypothetical protein
MVNKAPDVLIVVTKEIRNRIKVAAAREGLTMRAYLDRIVPKDP